MTSSFPSPTTSLKRDDQINVPAASPRLSFVSDAALEQAMLSRSIQLGRIPLDFVRRCPEVVELSVERGLPRRLLIVKRVMDVVLSILLGLLFIPFLPLIAIAIKLDSRGPVFYSQRRLGMHDKEFTIVKFRSMATDAEKDGAVFAKIGDPRVTRVGRFLRKTRIDEFPQLWTVLRGEMAVVGPRPERPEHMAKILNDIPEFWMRTSVKPGLTGWAQTHYRYSETIEQLTEKLEYDLFYIRFPGMTREIKVLYQTTKMMFGSHGQ